MVYRDKLNWVKATYYEAYYNFLSNLSSKNVSKYRKEYQEAKQWASKYLSNNERRKVLMRVLIDIGWLKEVG